MLETIKQDFEQVLESDTDSRDLRSLSMSLDTFSALSSALDVGIFQALIVPKSSSELAETLGLHAEITEKLCKALASRGYLCREGCSYALSDQARKFLTDSSPFYQGNLIKLMQRTRAQRWSGLARALKEGPIAAPSGHQVFDEFFALAMAEGAVGGSLQRTIRALKRMPQFHEARRCLDLGGSHGLYSLAFVRSNPDLEVVLFDLPKVIAGAAKKVVSDSERIVTMAGDFNSDDLGKDYDFVFASDVFYRDEKSLRPLLARIKECLKEGGLLISKHYHIDDLARDSSAALFDLMFSISGTGGVVYSSADFCRLLESAGFSIVQVDDISSPASPSKIITARKLGD